MLATLLTLQIAAAPATPTDAAVTPVRSASPGALLASPAARKAAKSTDAAKPATPAPAPPSATALSPTLTPVAAPASEVVFDAVLPCGLRVLTARDMSLPVAAVTLAVEVGSEDDPPELPGLVHALAYQVEQGNRELRPAEAVATAQDAGGHYNLATGMAQVRFESVIPTSRLDGMLWLESQRLRFPSSAPQRWEQSLGWAASDERGGSRLRPEALAFIHGAPGLGHDGRAVGKPLAALIEAALAAQLAAKFSYTRATLIVVGPESPERLLERVTPLFADLPHAPRSAPVRRVGPRPATPVMPAAPATPAPAPGATTEGKQGATPGAPVPGAMSPGTAPPVPGAMSPGTAPPVPGAMSPGTGVTVPLSRQRGYTFAWPVPPTAAAGAWATALCRAINRQKKAPEPEEARKARLSCDLEADPRRGVLILRPSNADDPWALVRARLARFAPGGADAALLQAQAATVAQALRLAVRTPQGLARQLSQAAVEASAASAPQFHQQHRVDDLTGLSALADPASLAREAPGLLRVEDAVVLTFPEPSP